ncbi:MAG: hypothetical protein WCB61_01540, partial [Pseudolabrys sp.]
MQPERRLEERLPLAEGKLDRLAVLATELVRMNVDVILTAGTESIDAARKATSLQLIYRDRIIALARQVGIPVAAEFDEFARAGALTSYGPSVI